MARRGRFALTGYFRRLADLVSSLIFRSCARALGCSRPEPVDSRPISSNLNELRQYRKIETQNRASCFGSCVALFLVICPMIPGLGSNRAMGQSWDRLPDGRVILQVKDVRFGFPAQGPDINFIEFRDTTSHRSLSLKEAIARPEDARELFRNAKVLDVSLPNLDFERGLFLERFPRSEFRSFRSDIAIGENVDANCTYWEKHFAQLRETVSAGNFRVGKSGWVEFEDTKKPPSFSFVRASGNQGEFVPGIHCDFTDTCGSSKCFGRNLAFSFQFSRKVFGRPAWSALSAQVHQMMQFILLDHNN